MKRSWMMLLVLALPLTAAAQRVSITPMAGVYVPLTNQGTWSFATESFERGVNQGQVFGMRIGVGWDRRHTIEATVLTAAAELRTTHTFVGGGEIYEDVAIEPVRNTFLTLQYRRALALSSRTDLALGIGTSLTKLDGSAYDDLRKLTYFGPMGSLSLMTSVGRTKVALSIADAMYSIQYTQPVNGQTSFTQHDLLVTAGLQIGGWK